MATQLSELKTQIKARLDELKVANVLGEVIEDDYKKGIFDRDFAAFPAAILTVPSIENEALTNTQNIRRYTFQVVIVCQAEDITSATDIEELIDKVINKFDDQITMQNTADGGVEPSTSSPEAAFSRGKNYIAFAVNIRARVVRDLTFT